MARTVLQLNDALVHGREAGRLRCQLGTQPRHLRLQLSLGSFEIVLGFLQRQVRGSVGLGGGRGFGQVGAQLLQL